MESGRQPGNHNATQEIKGIIRNPNQAYNRIFVAVPLTGNVRAEWMLARYGQVIPTNWAQVDYVAWIDQFSPLGYTVADARNLCVREFLFNGSEWLIFIDHDVVLPPMFYQTINNRILKEKIPVWSGLYFTKSFPAEPLVYKENGRGYFANWKMGDLVWTSAVPMGCTVIHKSLLEVMWNDAETYFIGAEQTNRVFDTPAKMWVDPVTQTWMQRRGTEDLDWCHRVITQGYFKKAGWLEFQKKKYPFLIDTNIFCRHITPDGMMYPAKGEESFFMSDKDKNQ